MRRGVLVLSLVAMPSLVATRGHAVRVLTFEEVAPSPALPPTNAAPLPSRIRARVKDDVPALAAADFKLRQTDVDPAVFHPASRSEAFKDSDEEMVVVFLVQGNERHDDVKALIDVVARVGPPKARGALIAYGEDAVMEQPMGPLREVRGESLGPPEVDDGVREDDLARGFEAALAALAADPARRKVLIYVGQCGDDSFDASIDGTIGKLEALEVEVYVVFQRPPYENLAASSRCAKLVRIGSYFRLTGDDEWDATATRIADDIDSLYTVEFDGEQLPPDGKEHTYVVLARRSESEEMAIALRNWEPVTHGCTQCNRHWGLNKVLLGLLALAAQFAAGVYLLWRIFRRRPA